MSEWPEHFPTACPPSDAQDSSGSAFRFIAGASVTVDDMKSLLELNPEGGNACRRASLSCYRTLDDVRAVQAIVPRFRGKSVAELALQVAYGKMKQTGREARHHSLWLRQKFLVQAHSLFRVVT